MGYVFISYSTKNQSIADSMRNLLQQKGLDTWMAPGDIPVGSKYAQVINGAVRNCSCFLVILSNDSQNSIWVAKEVERAVNYRKPIIPVMIDETVLNDEFELYISTDQIVAVKTIDENADAIKRIIKSISVYTASESFVDNDEHSSIEDEHIEKVKRKNTPIVSLLVVIIEMLIYPIAMYLLTRYANELQLELVFHMLMLFIPAVLLSSVILLLCKWNFVHQYADDSVLLWFAILVGGVLISIILCSIGSNANSIGSKVLGSIGYNFFPTVISFVFCYVGIDKYSYDDDQ